MRVRLHQTNEDFQAYDAGTRKGGNLTPAQMRFADAWRAMRPMQRDGLPWDCMVFGFQGGRPTQGAPFLTLSTEHPVQPADSLRLLGVAPLRVAETYSDEYRQRHAALRERGSHYRLHFFDLGSTVRDGDVMFDRNASNKSYQADVSKLPRQDHQFYSQRCFDPGSIGGLVAEASQLPSPAAQLLAPRSGAVTTMRDDLHFRIMIEGFDAFRFRLKDLPGIELLKASGQVRQGEVLGTLTTAMDFQEAEYNGNEPRICYIGGEVLSASRNLAHLAFATDAILDMVQYAKSQEQDETLLAGSDPAAIMPRHLVQFPSSVIKDRYEHGWQPNAAFGKLLCYYLGPEAKAAGENFLALRAPVTGILSAVARDDEAVMLTFVDHDGQQHGLAAPASAVLGAKAAKILAEGEDVEVVEGEALGDYVPRRWYENLAEVAALAGERGLRKIESEMFDAMLLRPGQLNWRGEGVCVDRQFVNEQLLPLAIGHWVDFSALEAFFVPEYNLYRLPPMQYDAKIFGFSRTVNQIHYDFTPYGPMFQGISQRVAEGDQRARRRSRRGRRRRNRSKSE